MMYLLYGNPILIAAAVIPAIFLLVQINKADKLDREPVGLLVSLVIQGIISTALAVLTERPFWTASGPRTPLSTASLCILRWWVCPRRASSICF